MRSISSAFVFVTILAVSACSSKATPRGSSPDGGDEGAGGGAGGKAGAAGSGAAGQGGGGAAGAGSGGAAGSAGSGGAVDASPPAQDASVDVVAGAKTDAAAGAAEAGGNEAKFSFFYTSVTAMQKLSGSPKGFGGDLRYGAPTGIEGADKICQTIAAGVGAGGKTWRAFLSVVKGPAGTPAHAIDRVGAGPWYDRNGRLIAMNKAGLLSQRPMGDAATVKDLPDETGQGTMRLGDTHDAVTASDTQGRLLSMDPSSTCQDWTSVGTTIGVGVGHAWPAMSGMHWIQAHTERSCAAGVNLMQNGPGDGTSIGSGGGWGGFYCFALTP